MVSRRSDRGSATIWVLGFGAVILAAVGIAVARGSAVLARHRLERAADLAALAAAQQIGRTGQPCVAASRIATANAATLASCAARLDPSGRSGTVTVVLRGTVTVPLAGTRTLTARSRAGRQATTLVPTPAAAMSRDAEPGSEAPGAAQPHRPAVRVVDGAVERAWPRPACAGTARARRTAAAGRAAAGRVRPPSCQRCSAAALSAKASKAAAGSSRSRRRRLPGRGARGPAPAAARGRSAGRRRRTGRCTRGSRSSGVVVDDRAGQLGVVRPGAAVDVVRADRGPDVVDDADLGVHVDRGAGVVLDAVHGDPVAAGRAQRVAAPAGGRRGSAARTTGRPGRGGAG